MDGEHDHAHLLINYRPELAIPARSTDLKVSLADYFAGIAPI